MDTFARIASRDIVDRSGELHEPTPPVLPDLPLPGLTKANAGTKKLKLASQISSKEQLQKELIKRRKQHAKFLADVAPAFPTYRHQQELQEFEWRMEDHYDSGNLPRVLSGKGKWEQVTIPHYGGPIGRATSYYRCEFTADDELLAHQHQWIQFKGVDYLAEVYLNGTFVGNHEGFFAPFDFDVTPCLKKGKNVLVVKVENDGTFLGYFLNGKREQGDKIYAATGVGWDDPELGWHHCPPGMGIYQAVYLEGRSETYVKDLFVQPNEDLEGATLWVDVFHSPRFDADVSLELSVFGQNFRKTVCRDVKVEQLPAVGPNLNTFKLALPLKGARRWDTVTPWLYQVQVNLFSKEGQLLDRQKCQFGMRTFRQDTENIPRGKWYLNDREVKLRGANTMGFEQLDVARKDWDQLIDDILLAKICHMNFLRITQRPVETEVYEYCDRLGLMVQTDLPLFGCMRRSRFPELVRQAEEMEVLIRKHPSCVLNSYINEPFAKSNGKPHRNMDRVEMESFFKAATSVIHLQNPDRVIKTVDGDYDPPSYDYPDNHVYNGWYNGHGLPIGKMYRGYWLKVKPDWHFGCGEFGAEGLEDESVMRRYYPKHWLPATEEEERSWDPGDIVRAQTGFIHDFWYDTRESLADWIATSQQHQAWAIKLQTECMRRLNLLNSMAIHLFIDAWPAGWMKTLMDCERTPKPATFAYLNALSPILLTLRSDRSTLFAGEETSIEFWLSNDTTEHSRKGTIAYQLLDAEENVLSQGKSKADLQAFGSAFQGSLTLTAPDCAQRSRYRLLACYTDATGKAISHNEFPFEVFPRTAIAKPSAVVVLGKGALPRACGFTITRKRNLAQDSVIFCEDVGAYLKDKTIWDEKVREGARLVFHRLPKGEYEIGDQQVTIEGITWCSRVFVSRKTGHELVSGYEELDFRWWYNSAQDYVDAFLSTTFEVDKGWLPILTTNHSVGGWENKWRKSMAAAEVKMGKGSIIINQVELDDFVDANPIARDFASRLLQPA